MKKKALVIHSGGMDSSLCLKLALQKYGASAVLSISFSYGQKHSVELECAKKICSDWNIQHEVLDLSVLQKITENALTHHEIPIVHKENSAPNTLVVGRNGLMARLAAIYAHTLEVREIYMGVMELEVANSGYPDCSREYMDLKEKILQKDLNDPKFRIVTPLIHMTKKESMELAHSLGVLPYLLKNTVSCYEGILGKGCEKCPACLLRNKGITDFLTEHPEIKI